MDNKTVRTAGVIAGIVVVLGILVIGAQYFSQISGGASAQVIDMAQLPDPVLVPKEDYISMQALFDSYASATDLATKNQKIQELRGIFDSLAK